MTIRLVAPALCGGLVYILTADEIWSLSILIGMQVLGSFIWGHLRLNGLRPHIQDYLKKV